MGINVFDLFAKISLDSKEFTSGVEAASATMKGLASVFGSLMTGALADIGTAAIDGAKLLTNGIIEVGKYANNVTSQVAAVGDSIAKTAQKVGISAEAYQEWSAILQHSGTDASQMIMATKTLANAVQNPTDEAAAAFNRLGISIESAANMTQEDLFASVIKGLQNMESGTERTALAQKLLGRSSMEFAALLNTSAEDTEKMRQRVHELGGVMSAEALKASEAYTDSLQDMRTAFTGIKRTIGADLLPSITAFMNGITDLATGSDSASEKIAAAIDGIFTKGNEITVNAMKSAANILPNIVHNVIANAPKVFAGITDIMQTLGNAIIENTPILAETAGQVALNFLDFLANSYDIILDGAVKLLETFGKFISQNAGKLASKAAEIIEIFASNLTNNNTLSKLVSAAVNIISGLATALLQPNTLKSLVSAGLDLVKAIAGAISDNLPLILHEAGNIANAILEFFTTPENVESILLAGMEIITTLGTGLANAAGEVAKFITGLAEDIADYFGFGDYWRAGKEVIDEFMKGVTAKWNEWKGFWENIGEYIYDSMHDENGNVDWSNYWHKALNPDAEQTQAKEIKTYTFGESDNLFDRTGGWNTAAAEEAKRKAGFATGGIVTRPIHALIGEAGAEAIIPLENNTGWIDRIADRIESRTEGATAEITVNVNNPNLANGYDTETMVQDIIAIIDTKLRDRQIRLGRAIGGTGWK